MTFAGITIDQLETANASALDALPFGAIGISADGHVETYNATESRLAGLPRERVVGKHFFSAIGLCMNNFMVAQRFEDAKAAGTGLDATVDYVLTLRMRPVKVKLRLLADPGSALRYVLVCRKP